MYIYACIPYTGGATEVTGLHRKRIRMERNYGGVAIPDHRSLAGFRNQRRPQQVIIKHTHKHTHTCTHTHNAHTHTHTHTHTHSVIIYTLS